MDDIIFENRNKQYGAYELRKNYHNRLSKSFVISLAIPLSILFLSIIRSKPIPIIDFSSRHETVHVVDDFIVVQNALSQNRTSAPQSQPDKHSYLAVTDTTIDEKKPDTLLAATGPVGVDTVGISEGGGQSDTIIADIELPSGPKPLSAASVEKIPEFPGGIEKFYAYLIKRIHYTEDANRASVKGKMYVKFIVDEEGFVTNVSILSKIGYGLDEQVQSVLNESPKWMPGLVKNSAVRTEMILPVNFNLR